MEIERRVALEARAMTRNEVIAEKKGISTL